MMSEKESIITIIKNADSMKLHSLIFDGPPVDEYTEDDYNYYMKRKIIFLKSDVSNIKLWLNSIKFEIDYMSDEDFNEIPLSILGLTLVEAIENNTLSPEKALAYKVKSVLYDIMFNFGYFLFACDSVDKKFNSKYFEPAQVEYNAFQADINKIFETIKMED